MKSRYLLAALMLPSLLQGQSANPTVRFTTSNWGDIDVELFADTAPRTVANFLNYVRRGDYNNTFIHRAVSVGISVIQGGGFTMKGSTFAEIKSDPPIADEFRTPNTRGTIAMAKTSQPNSATNQWFFNVANNSSSLDRQNFSVFGRIINPGGLAAMNDIWNLPRFAIGPGFEGTPMVNFQPGVTTVT
ncbi:MAG: peptidylprolyl isomerase, partial [Acidobacteria bacterium]|nr:peptidylprolyl isomerase [Acidobacteriota bacterium]